MTDLTDKWKKGELPSGWYYVRLIRGEYRIDLYINGKNEWIDCPDNIIDTIVCEVPSYDELVYLHKARNDAHEIVESLTQENQQLKKWCEEFNSLNVAKENIKLKEQLEQLKNGYFQDSKNLAQKLLQVKPELRDWLEVNFKEYL